MTGGQLKKMLVLEGLLYTLAAVLASLLLTVVMGPLLGTAVNSLFWFFTYRFTLAPILLIFPIFVVLGLVIPLLTYRSIARHTVVERLREAGLQVKDFDMRLAARLVKDHKLSSIHTGTYEFKPDLTPAGILETLARGPIVDQSLRIPDGAPVWEVLAIFRNATALKQTAASMPEAELRRALGIDAGSLEGWFAPDTYHYTSGSADLAVMKQAVAKQKALLAKAWESRSEATRVKTPYEALTLASIIEKETGLATDRHLVSSVFNNRLSIGMPLQTDPTVIYGLGEKFSGNITRKDLQTPTPYNTYVIPALPPTPIAAPTWASIEAAVNPADTRFLYFVSKGDGSSHFSQSLAEHNRAVRQFILNRPKTQKKAKPKEPQPTKETARSITPV